MVEGISWIALLICMPFKHLYQMPMGVRIVGPIHGALFVLLMWLIYQAWEGKALSKGRAIMVVIASLIPFGPFLIDRRLAESTAAETADSPD